MLYNYCRWQPDRTVTTESDHRARRHLIGLVLLGLAVRVIMPAGYMPAPIGEGGPFVLCPGGLSGAQYFLADDGEHADGHEHDPDDARQANAWAFCPLGAVFGSAVLVTDLVAAVPSPLTFVPAADPQSVEISTAIRTTRVRGPPQQQPLHV